MYPWKLFIQALYRNVYAYSELSKLTAYDPLLPWIYLNGGDNLAEDSLVEDSLVEDIVVVVVVEDKFVEDIVVVVVVVGRLVEFVEGIVVAERRLVEFVEDKPVVGGNFVEDRLVGFVGDKFVEDIVVVGHIVAVEHIVVVERIGVVEHIVAVEHRSVEGTLAAVHMQQKAVVVRNQLAS